MCSGTGSTIRPPARGTLRSKPRLQVGRHPLRELQCRPAVRALADPDRPADAPTGSSAPSGGPASKRGCRTRCPHPHHRTASLYPSRWNRFRYRPTRVSNRAFPGIAACSRTLAARRGRRPAAPLPLPRQTQSLIMPTGRDLPGLAGTSSLSPHLHFGEIGPRQILHGIQARTEVELTRKGRLRTGGLCARTGLAGVRPAPALPLSPHLRAAPRPPLSSIFPGDRVIRACDDLRPGSRATPAFRSWMRVCGSCGAPAGCTTGCA